MGVFNKIKVQAYKVKSLGESKEICGRNAIGEHEKMKLHGFIPLSSFNEGYEKRVWDKRSSNSYLLFNLNNWKNTHSFV
ncbi:hypothetical protein CBF30_10020 [Vagococcus entomophilus]|uniref:Uncharacterized protein n=1 Tax=Vagococcus entomophilus TaxID=1160095 RepID=A0A430AFR8_9ENTE|nr:hypothetical protein CBF30_10020 [Vagococcus entomophilus]